MGRQIELEENTIPLPTVSFSSFRRINFEGAVEVQAPVVKPFKPFDPVLQKKYILIKKTKSVALSQEAKALMNKIMATL